MNLHEYQAKNLLKQYGLATPIGTVAGDSASAVAAAKNINSQQYGGQYPSQYVVKAQIHAGGRGKAGGVKLLNSLSEVEAYAKKLLGNTLVTYQNTPDGQLVSQVLVEETLHIARELY